MYSKKPAKKRNNRILFNIIFILLLVVFFVSGYYVFSYVIESQKSENLYEDLAAIVDSVQEPTEDAASAAGETEPDRTYDDPDKQEMTEKSMIRGYEKLYNMNNDTVGWIKIEGTDINYPVMQTPDEKDYYLRRNFEKESSAHGCIYVREECDVFEPSDNVTIYGHHMQDGSMFAALDNYLNKDFWEENKTIRFDTLYEQHTYEIFAVFKTTATVNKGFDYHAFVNAANEEDFDWFISNCKQLAFYDTGITPEYGDKIICLSTCEYTMTNGRLVVAAVLVE